jgi:hypothetical protein
MTQADSVHSTPRRFTPKIVGGIDHLPNDQSRKQSTDAHESADARRPAESLSITAQNGRLLKKRYEAWRAAGAATRYWRAQLDFHDALWCVQRRGMSEGRSHPAVDSEDRQALVDKWRAAFVKQLLTPASDAASVAWKQNALTRGKYQYTGLKPERLKHAIDDDMAFLAAHPVRQSNSEAMARRREFKEAMRQRIRDIAASRDLSDEEIKPVLKLKHHEIAEFTEKHGVNLEWLLEGRGRIFKKDQINLSPKMTGDEFAAVVATMPMADQQAIRATVREILQERDQ